SGGTVYGETERLPLVESAPKLPASPYGTAKLASEYYLATFSQLYGLETVALRYGNVYGPRQNPHGEAGVVAIFAHRVLAGQPLTVFGDGHQTRDMVVVPDGVDANLAASRGALPPVDGTDGRCNRSGRADSVLFQVGRAVPTTPWELVLTSSRETKFVLAILVVFSIVSWYLIFLKWWQFRRMRRQADRFMAEIGRATRLDD